MISNSLSNYASLENFFLYLILFFALAQWLIANMPYDKATHDKPFLTSEEVLDLAAFINDDTIHQRPSVKEFDYPHFEEKAIDYDRGPFNDTFSVAQHKYGPFKPIINYWKSKGLHPSF